MVLVTEETGAGEVGDSIEEDEAMGRSKAVKLPNAAVREGGALFRFFLRGEDEFEWGRWDGVDRSSSKATGLLDKVGEESSGWTVWRDTGRRVPLEVPG